MTSIVFVCHGNICRSPMAEFVCKAMLARLGVTDVEVASRATSSEEIWGGVGNPIYPPAQEQLRRHRIPYDSTKRAQRLSAQDVQHFDYIVVMDDGNVRNTKRLFPHATVYKLLDFADGGNVADPWYTGDFDQAYQDIERGVQALLDNILD